MSSTAGGLGGSGLPGRRPADVDADRLAPDLSDAEDHDAGWVGSDRDRVADVEGAGEADPQAGEGPSESQPDGSRPDAEGPDGPDGPDRTDDEVGEFEELDEVAAAYAERDNYLDSLRRLQADFENYKKRMVKQHADAAERAAAGLVDKLLPVLDTADLACSHGAGEALDRLRAGLLEALQREGLERIDPDGGPFDPNVHDAVAHEPGDGDQEVAEVLRAGYRWKGRVLRPAMVKVRG